MAECVRTICPLCGVGCGVIVEPAAGTLVVRGDPDHPANYGRLCARGAALGRRAGLDGRLLHPTLRGALVGWDAAVAALADALTRTIVAHGPDAVAVTLSGRLLTEDHYVVNKLMKGFIGSANIGGAPHGVGAGIGASVAGQRRAYGCDTVPGSFDDLELADLVVLVGSDLAADHPVLQQRLATARRQRRTKVVVVDPRCTASCDEADMHLQLRPGSDVALFNGLLAHLHLNGRGHRRFLAEHAAGAGEAVATAQTEAPTLTAVAARCGLSAASLHRFYELFAANERVVTIIAQGLERTERGADAVTAILNAHLYTGRIGRPGMGPLPVPERPNAMGGREVGSLSDQLAAHMAFTPEEVYRVRRFWDAPRMASGPGLSGPDLLTALEEGRIKALWIMEAGPPLGLADPDHLSAVLERCDFVAVSDGHDGGPLAGVADLVLPAAVWGEKDGTVTAADRTISRLRRWREPPGEARPDWWIAAAVGRAMGWAEAFDFTSPAAVFREHAALSAFENIASRAFDIGALASLSDGEYELLEPAPWPRRSGGPPVKRLFAGGGFYTEDGRARLIPVCSSTEAA